MPANLSSIPYFFELNAGDLQAVEQSAVRKTYQPEQVVLMEGERVGGLFVVESGWLKAVKLSAAGREQVLNFLGPGDGFNGVAVFTEAPNPASVVALEESLVWSLSRDTMQQLLETHPGLARGVIRDLAGRIQHLVGLVEDLSLRCIQSRLARTLLDGIVNNEIPRRKWATQNEMAARLGTVPDVLNRALRKLVEEGLISVARHQIRIIDPEGLRSKIDID